MNVKLAELAKIMLAMSEGEMKAVVALDWLEQDTNLPDSIRKFFWAKLERAADAVLPTSESEPLRGCGDVTRYRVAFDAHFARRSAARRGIDGN